MDTKHLTNWGGLTVSVVGEMLRGPFWLLSIQGLGSEQQGALGGLRGEAQCWKALHHPPPQDCGGATGTGEGCGQQGGRAHREAGEWTAVS